MTHAEGDGSVDCCIWGPVSRVCRAAFSTVCIQLIVKLYFNLYVFGCDPLCGPPAVSTPILKPESALRVCFKPVRYGAMDGIPSCANAKINNALYRETFGFTGFMVSDCDAVGDFAHFPALNASTPAEATAKGVLGGLDMDCGQSYMEIPAAVQAGLLSEQAVRTSTERFLTAQIALGTLEPTPFDGIGKHRSGANPR